MNMYVESNHGLAVNLYLIGKMFSDSNLQNIREMMLDDYERTLKSANQFEYDLSTFASFVNDKRQWIAAVLGRPEFY